jgi:hypothetical protein
LHVNHVEGVVMRRVFVLFVLSCALLGFPQLAAAEADDDIPGIPITTSPVMGYLIAGVDRADVFSVSMKQYDALSLKVNGNDTYNNFWAQVFAPDAMGIYTTDALEATTHYGSYPKSCTFHAPAAGTYYVAIATNYYVGEGEGNYSLTWTCKSPTITALTSRSRSIRRGTVAPVAGRIAYAADGMPATAIPVALQKSRKGASWQTVASRKTDASGSFSFKVRPTKTTYYRALFSGTPSLITSTSARVKIRVR